MNYHHELLNDLDLTGAILAELVKLTEEFGITPGKRTGNSLEDGKNIVANLRSHIELNAVKHQIGLFVWACPREWNGILGQYVTSKELCDYKERFLMQLEMKYFNKEK